MSSLSLGLYLGENLPFVEFWHRLNGEGQGYLMPELLALLDNVSCSLLPPSGPKDRSKAS